MVDHLIIFDTETSGLSADAGVVEAAFIEIDDDMTILREVRSLINPGCPISPSASGVHHITDDMVVDAPSLIQFLEKEIPGYADKTLLMIAHNAPFDAKFLKPHIGKLETLCTLRLARRAFPESPDHKLPTLMYHLKLDRRGAHNALDDVYTCLGVLQAACAKMGMTLEQVYHLLRKPQKVTHMPFGKEHKGKKLEDVPHSFLTWCLGLADLDPDLRFSIQEVMKTKRRGRA